MVLEIVLPGLVGQPVEVTFRLPILFTTEKGA